MSRHKTLQKVFEEVDIEALYNMIFEAADWQMVLVASTFLDRMLEFAIGRAFKNELTPTEQAEIFSGYGPLASFSARITIAYALGAMSIEARNDLRVVKSIRNEAAHRMTHFSLQEGVLKQYCDSLKLTAPIDLSSFEPDPMSERLKAIDASSPRGRFILSIHHIMEELGKDMIVVVDALAEVAKVIKTVDSPELRQALKGIADSFRRPVAS
jgi:DNA-binding MltR family transcriptional regulator